MWCLSDYLYNQCPYEGKVTSTASGGNRINVGTAKLVGPGVPYCYPSLDPSYFVINGSGIKHYVNSAGAGYYYKRARGRRPRRPTRPRRGPRRGPQTPGLCRISDSTRPDRVAGKSSGTIPSPVQPAASEPSRNDCTCGLSRSAFQRGGIRAAVLT